MRFVEKQAITRQTANTTGAKGTDDSGQPLKIQEIVIFFGHKAAVKASVTLTMILTIIIIYLYGPKDANAHKEKPHQQDFFAC